MEFLSQIFSLIVILGILVFFHELGHFLAAKAFRMRVDRFSIGFPPRAFGKKIGDTDYCVSWIPLGGYVKIAGMVDESLDTAHLTATPEPWEFRAKPIWQRMIVITAGVIMNVLLAILIFWGLFAFRGVQTHEVTTIGHVLPGSIAEKGGFQAGDRILSINGTSVTVWEDVQRILIEDHMVTDLSFSITRNGSPVTLTLSRREMTSLPSVGFGAVAQGVSVLITEVRSGAPAEKVGLKAGDRIVSVNDTLVHDISMARARISVHRNESFKLSYLRDGKPFSTFITPNEDGLIGVGFMNEFSAPVRYERYGVFEALGIGVEQMVVMTRLTVLNIWQVITGQVSFRSSIGGPVRIAEMASDAAKRGIDSFLSLMAVLSISLAIINILPFPALDGGHLFFLTYEGIFRREIPTKVKVVLQQAGMVLLLAFMAFVLYNDIFR